MGQGKLGWYRTSISFKTIFFASVYFTITGNKQTNPLQIFSFWKKKVGGKNQGLIRFRGWRLGVTSAGGRLPGWAEGKGEMVEFEVRRQELLLLPCSFLSGSSGLLSLSVPLCKMGWLRGLRGTRQSG